MSASSLAHVSIPLFLGNTTSLSNGLPASFLLHAGCRDLFLKDISTHATPAPGTFGAGQGLESKVHTLAWTLCDPPRQCLHTLDVGCKAPRGTSHGLHFPPLGLCSHCCLCLELLSSFDIFYCRRHLSSPFEVTLTCPFSKDPVSVLLWLSVASARGTPCSVSCLYFSHYLLFPLSS